MIKAILQSYGFYDVKSYGIIIDTWELIDQTITHMLSECDIIITSGGVSMGEKDLMKPYLESKGEILFGRLNMKPGKPTTLARINTQLIFAFPGNPVSCFVTAHLFISRALKIISGDQNYQFPLIKVKITKEIRLDKE